MFDEKDLIRIGSALTVKDSNNKIVFEFNFKDLFKHILTLEDLQTENFDDDGQVICKKCDIEWDLIHQKMLESVGL